jgi:hypothetical protein
VKRRFGKPLGVGKQRLPVRTPTTHGFWEMRYRRATERATWAIALYYAATNVVDFLLLAL